MKRDEKIEIGGSFIMAPVPVVLLGCQHDELGKNLITIAWTGIGTSDPETVYASIRPSRHSFRMIKESGCFSVNIPTVDLLEAVDTCGIVSGKKVDKFERTGLTAIEGKVVKAPLVAECPVNLECRVINIYNLGLHHMFVGEVVAKHASKGCLSKGKVDSEKIDLITYIHGEYWSLGKKLERAGFSL